MKVKVPYEWKFWKLLYYIVSLSLFICDNIIVFFILMNNISYNYERKNGFIERVKVIE